MIEIYESNFVEEIDDGTVSIETAERWPFLSEFNNLDEFMSYCHGDRSYSFIKINDMLYKRIDNYFASDYYYMSTTPEEIYRQIKRDQIEKL